MRIQTGLIHFGRVHTESGLSETGFKPVWSQSTSRCGLNADSNRFRNNCVGGNVMSHDRTRVAHQEQHVSGTTSEGFVHSRWLADGRQGWHAHSLASGGRITCKVSWRTEWFEIGRYSRVLCVGCKYVLIKVLIPDGKKCSVNQTNSHQCGLNAHSAKLVSNQFKSTLLCEHAFIGGNLRRTVCKSGLLLPCRLRVLPIILGSHGLACCFYTQLAFQAIVGLKRPKKLSKHMNIIILWYCSACVCVCAAVASVDKCNQGAWCYLIS